MANPEHLKILEQGVAAWNQWRKDNPNVTPDLSTVNLSDADLRNANLVYADLHNADLRDANLSGAILIKVDFSEADLSGADLSKAALHKANFSKADLKNTNFTLSVILFSVFGNVDLSVAKGLDKIIHPAPSTIRLDTIYKSPGNIDEVFLKGTGVSDDFITHMHSLTLKPSDFYSCFISYSHADKSFAKRLHDTLQGRGIRCWLDEHQLIPGDDMHDQIDRGIRLWDKVILCCSEKSLNSWWVDKELDKALQKEEALQKQRGKKTLALVPIDLDGYIHQWQDGKASMIKSRFIADFKGWDKDNEKFEEQFEKLINALKTEDAGREPPPQPKL